MKIKILIPLLAVAVVTGGLLIAHAATNDNVISMAGHGRIWQRIAKKLELTGDQKTQIKAVFVADKDPILTLLTRLHDAHKQLRAVIESDKATEDSVRSAAANVAAAESDLAVERLKLHSKIAPILTPGQKLQLTVMEDKVDIFLDGVIARIGAGLSQGQ